MRRGMYIQYWWLLSRLVAIYLKTASRSRLALVVLAAASAARRPHQGSAQAYLVVLKLRYIIVVDLVKRKHLWINNPEVFLY